MLACLVVTIDVAMLFFVALLLSAAGALPVGLINLSIARLTITNGKGAGSVAAVGAALVEFGYTFIAVYFIDLLVKSDAGNYIKIFSIVVFISLGAYYLLKKNSPTMTEEHVPRTRSFAHGVGLALINLLILPYWIFLTVWLKSNDFIIQGLTDVLIISMGSAVGAFLVFLTYVYLGALVVKKVEKVNVYLNRVLGVLFLILAVVQSVRLFL